MAIQDVDPQYLPLTSRYAQLATLGAYFDGTQYKGRGLKPWRDDSVPMAEREPSIVYPLPKAAVNQATNFAVGDGKFPQIKCEEIEADAIAPVLAMAKEDAEDVTKAIADLVSSSRLQSAVRRAMRKGLSARTACLVMSVRDGLFAFEHPDPKDCVPIFADGPDSRVTALVWSYEYEETVADNDGKPRCVRMRFRRDYNDTSVIEYEPEEVKHGDRAEWRVSRVEAHGLGFCPVFWVRNLDGHAPQSIDGVSLYDGLEDEIDALNRALSQRHHGLEILGVPQPYETGVDNGDGPGPAGRSAAPVPTNPKAPMAGWSAPKGNAGAPARKGGAAHMWSYRGEGVEIGLLETTGKAFEVATEHVKDIRGRLLEAMNIVLLDAQSVAGKGDMSAKALSLMYAPMLALVDEIRETWWARCIKPIVERMLEVVSKLPVGSVFVCGASRIAAVLAGRRVAMADGSEAWIAPRIEPLWGSYFAPSAEDAKVEVETAATALEKKLVSAETATRYVASCFGIGDVEQEREEIEEEAAEAAEQAMAVAADAPPNGDGDSAAGAANAPAREDDATEQEED